jgi:hypothetical protein
MRISLGKAGNFASTTSLSSTSVLLACVHQGGAPQNLAPIVIKFPKYLSMGVGEFSNILYDSLINFLYSFGNLLIYVELTILVSFHAFLAPPIPFASP